jgi:hypothetical protein
MMGSMSPHFKMEPPIPNCGFWQSNNKPFVRKPKGTWKEENLRCKKTTNHFPNSPFSRFREET